MAEAGHQRARGVRTDARGQGGATCAPSRLSARRGTTKRLALSLSVQLAMLEYFQPLLSLGQALLRDAQEAVQAGGAELFVAMFTCFPQAPSQTV